MSEVVTAIHEKKPTKKELIQKPINHGVTLGYTE